MYWCAARVFGKFKGKVAKKKPFSFRNPIFFLAGYKDSGKGFQLDFINWKIGP
jgi:hypothetical protein